VSSPDQIRPLLEIEKQAIEEAIRICQDNVPLAAARLGVSPSTLYRKLKSWEHRH
jgi:two-component system repressor protein LuxO